MRWLALLALLGLLLGAGATWADVQVKDTTSGNALGVNVFRAGRIMQDNSDKATYVACSATLGITAASPLLNLESGPTLVTRLRRLMLFPGTETTAAWHSFTLRRDTTASSAGTVVTAAPYDAGDAAFSGVIRAAATAGTVGVTLYNFTYFVPTTTLAMDPFVLDFDVMAEKAIKIPVGTANGIELRDNTGGAGGANMVACFVFTEESS